MIKFKQLEVNHYFKFFGLPPIPNIDRDYPLLFVKTSNGKIRQYGKKEEIRLVKNLMVVDFGQEVPLWML